MSSLNLVPNSTPIPNPNPNFPGICQCSSPNGPQITPTNPNWLLLPRDLWLSILSRLYTWDILLNVRNVCKLFRRICRQRSLFRIINMLPSNAVNCSRYVVAMTYFAVNRSAGQLVDVFLEYCGNEMLMYIVQRSKNLKHLRIGHHTNISDHVLVEAVENLPVLEEVEIIMCGFWNETIEDLGQACPSLKSFCLNYVGSRHDSIVNNDEAFAIALSMPNLRSLQLIGNCLSDYGLNAILDNCPLLESLDLRACFYVDLSGELGQRCAKINHLRCPHDSTADYAYQTFIEGDDTSQEEPEWDYRHCDCFCSDSNRYF